MAKKKFEIDLRRRTATRDLEQSISVIEAASMREAKLAGEEMKRNGGWEFVRVYKVTNP